MAVATQVAQAAMPVRCSQQASFFRRSHTHRYNAQHKLFGRGGESSRALSREPGQSARPSGRPRPAGTQANNKGLPRQNRGTAEAPLPKASGSALDPGACSVSTKCLRGGVHDDLGYRLQLLGGIPRLTEMVRHRGSDSPFETSGKSGTAYPRRAPRLQGLFNPLKMAYKTAK